MLKKFQNVGAIPKNENLNHKNEYIYYHKKILIWILSTFQY